MAQQTHGALFIDPVSPWEDGYELFNSKMRDELFKREMFTTLAEARGLLEQWEKEYNTTQPHSALRYRTQAPEAKI